MNKQTNVINHKKSYWLYVEPYVHIAVKKKHALLYNTLSGELLEYGAGEPEIVRAIKAMQSPENLGVIPIGGARLEQPPLSRLLHDLRMFFMGDILEESESKGKPVQLAPALKIQKDIVKMKKGIGRSPGEEIMSYLEELILYIGSRCGQDCQPGCSLCSGEHPAFRQFACCRKAKGREKELTAKSLENLLGEAQATSLTAIQLLGGNILRHSQFEELTTLLNSQPRLKVYHLHYLHLRGHGEKLAHLAGKAARVLLTIHFPADLPRAQEALSQLRAAGVDTAVRLVVRGEADLEQAQDLAASSNISDAMVQPWYDGGNLAFFEKYVFVDRDTIRQIKPTERQIYAQGVVNTVNFGKVTIFSNGRFHTGVNAPSLGRLGRDPLYKIIYKEMTRGRSWFRVRKNLAPCNRCTFNALCPAPSHYEQAIGKNDFCHIAREK